MSCYQFTPDMREISGFGGDYEDACRAMLVAGLEWLDANPEADLQFHGYENIYGVICEDNDDAKALSKAVVAASDGDCSGAMHQATISSVLWIKANGWDAYVRKMTHPGGRAGILQEKLDRKEDDYERLSKRFDELRAECDRRGVIIAEEVLGWQEHDAGNGFQTCYAPTAEAARGIGFGRQLSRLVDEAIGRMSVSTKVAG